MRPTFRLALPTIFLLGLLLSCVDPEAIILHGTVDVVVVDGTITDLNEPQVVRLSRSVADRLTGRPGSLPLTGATVEVLVDSGRVVAARETQQGSYQLPTGFYGQIGHTYQLRFRLSDGSRYVSDRQVMPAVPPIELITDQYNPQGFSYSHPDGLLASSDLHVKFTDPADQSNFYRWDWVLWERQNWCQTCVNGNYYQYDDMGMQIDRCVPLPPRPFQGTVSYDYECRTQCWDIFFSNQLNLFADTYTNGRVISGRRVGQIPFYQYAPALAELRQSALTPSAYAYMKLLDELSQRTGGLADAPPKAPIGNVRNLTNGREAVIGYFTASGVSAVRYWLTRRNVAGGLPFAPGTELSNVFFRIINQRDPVGDPLPGRGRPPLAVCVESGTRTQTKPSGWRD